MNTAIPGGTRIVGTYEGTGRSREWVSYYPYSWVPIDIPNYSTCSQISPYKLT